MLGVWAGARPQCSPEGSGEVGRGALRANGGGSPLRTPVRFGPQSPPGPGSATPPPGRPAPLAPQRPQVPRLRFPRSSSRSPAPDSAPRPFESLSLSLSRPPRLRSTPSRPSWSSAPHLTPAPREPPPEPRPRAASPAAPRPRFPLPQVPAGLTCHSAGPGGAASREPRRPAPPTSRPPAPRASRRRSRAGAGGRGRGLCCPLAASRPMTAALSFQGKSGPSWVLAARASLASERGQAAPEIKQVVRSTAVRWQSRDARPDGPGPAIHQGRRPGPPCFGGRCESAATAIATHLHKSSDSSGGQKSTRSPRAEFQVAAGAFLSGGSSGPLFAHLSSF